MSMGSPIRVRAVVKDRHGKVVDTTINPYRPGSAKRVLMDWAMAQESFTKDEFLAAAEELHATGQVASVMASAVMARAWWNEFYSKYGVFIPCDED